jgi:hypothetical protein
MGPCPGTGQSRGDCIQIYDTGKNAQLGFFRLVSILHSLIFF